MSPRNTGGPRITAGINVLQVIYVFIYLDTGQIQLQSKSYYS